MPRDGHGSTVWAHPREGAPLSRPILRLWSLVVVPLVVLPVVFISGLVLPASFLASHALFHIVYIPVIVLAILAGLAYSRQAPTALTRNLARAVVAFQLVGLFGHTGELVTVFLHGGFGAPESLFDEAWHAFFADFAPTGLAAGALTVIALTVAAAVQGRSRSATAAEGPAVGP